MPDQTDAVNAGPHVHAAAVQRAMSRQLSLTDLFGVAEQLKALGAPQLGADLYKTWIAFNDDNPLLYAAFFNYAMSLSEQGDRAGALNALRAALAAKPDFNPAHINLGSLLDQLGHKDRAVEAWMRLVDRFKTVDGEAVKYKTMGLNQIARVLEAAQSDAAAESALRQSLDIDPNQIEAVQHWVALRQRQCKWPTIEDWDRAPRAKLVAGMSPLTSASFADDPLFQLSHAWAFNRNSIGRPAPSAMLPKLTYDARRTRKRLRIGYVSSDLRDHAVGFSMTEVVELHDREHFEVFAYYCGIPGTDSTQQRIRAAVDHWTDINGMDDATAAARIREDGIDILIDLNGYTKDARTKVFALQPAPINVNWFGFPSTMGTSYHHYIIADPYLVPAGQEIYFSEKVVRLACYQPNDRKRSVAARKAQRSDEGLPENAFVFCCLNGMQKITAATFEDWMTILAQVPDSVLWLLSGTDDTNARLVAQAASRGIAADRLIFAAKRANPDHVARYALADLFLDTAPYGAHTTAADSLWMGVPIITVPGKTFAARVCASLVRAAGLGDLVCADRADYVARAIGFGRDPATLKPYHDHLVDNRDTCLLFDMPRLMRDLEDLYRGMWRDFKNGALPCPDLVNLDLYREISLELDLEAMIGLSLAEYEARYREKLAERDAYAVVAPDSRLWCNGPIEARVRSVA